MHVIYDKYACFTKIVDLNKNIYWTKYIFIITYNQKDEVIITVPTINKS